VNDQDRFSTQNHQFADVFIPSLAVLPRDSIWN
jgi:hypothetical protein